MKKLILQTAMLMGVIFFNLSGGDFIQFYKNEVFIPGRLGNLVLYKDCYGFHVVKDGQIYDIQNCFCDSLLREMSDEQLINFLGRNKIILLNPEQFGRVMQGEEVEITGAEKDRFISKLHGEGYIVVNQLDNGEYILHAKSRLLGGGKGQIPIIPGVAIPITEEQEEAIRVTSVTGGGLGFLTAFFYGPGLIAVHAVVDGVVSSGVGAAVSALGGGAAVTTAGAGVATLAVTFTMAAPFLVAGGLTYLAIRRLTKATEEPSTSHANPGADAQGASSSGVNSSGEEDGCVATPIRDIE